jgi:hypothetical protein
LKITESIISSQIEFDATSEPRDKIQNINKNHLLIDFLGKQNTNLLMERYPKKN